MIDFAAHRAKLQERFAVVREKTTVAPEDATLACDHDRREFKETVRADNPKFEGAAHFVVVACVKCREKRRQKLVVEV